MRKTLETIEKMLLPRQKAQWTNSLPWMEYQNWNATLAFDTAYAYQVSGEVQK